MEEERRAMTLSGNVWL